MNDVPDMDAALAVVPALKALESELRASDPAATTDELVHTGYGYLVEAASKIARIPRWTLPTNLESWCSESSTMAYRRIGPQTAPTMSNYDGGWSSLPGRIEAVEGLFSLFANPGFDSQHILANLRTLAQDRLPVVRFQVAWRLLQLYERAPEAMWELIQSLATDPNYRIRLEVIAKLDQCARAHPDRALALVAKMLEDAGSARGKPEEVTTAASPVLRGTTSGAMIRRQRLRSKGSSKDCRRPRTMPAECFPHSGMHSNTSSQRIRSVLCGRASGRQSSSTRSPARRSRRCVS